MRRVNLVVVLSLVAACAAKDKPKTVVNSGLVLPGLGAPVDVALDENGIPHVSCKSDGDCFEAQGYLHAQNRFWEMDAFRHLARGKLGELTGTLLLGPDEVSALQVLRAFLSTKDGQPIEEATWADLQKDPTGADAVEGITAYARGVNAWLADLRAGRNGARLPDEYGVLGASAADIADWDPLDTMAFARLLTYQLGETSSDEFFFTQAAAGTLDATTLDDLFIQKPGLDSFTMTASGVDYPFSGLRAEPTAADVAASWHVAPGAAAMAARVLPTMAALHSIMAPFGDPAGSNNWAVGPSRTADHHALLSNDPHLSLYNPSYWYFLELDSKSSGGKVHVAGASFPGAPGVLIGRNEKLAWGETVVYYDTSDVYLEQLTDDNAKVKFNGAEVPLISQVQSFGVRGGTALTRTFQWVPHHGLVMSVDPAAHTALSVRWTGMESSQEVKAFLGLDRAGSVDEGFTALEDFKVGAQNFVMIDTGGHIGWDPHAYVPNRPWAAKYGAAAAGHTPWLPLDGTGTAEWAGPTGMLEDRLLPSMKDPPKGFIATANGDATGATKDGDPTAKHPLLQDWPAVSFRHGRIVELLGGPDGNRADHSLQTMMDMQGDHRSILGATIVPPLLVQLRDSGVPLDVDGEGVRLALVDWLGTDGDFQCPTGLDGTDPAASNGVGDLKVAKQAAGCAAFHYLLRELYSAIFGDELTRAFPGTTRAQALEMAGQERLSRTLTYLLTTPDSFHDAAAIWDDRDTIPLENEGMTIAAAFAEAAKKLKKDFSGGVLTWQWGRVHTVSMEGILPGLTDPLGPYANDGGQYTIDVADISPAPGKPFTSGAGSSLRIIDDAGPDGIESVIELPGGEVGYKGAGHQKDLVPGWLANQHVPLYFGGKPAFTPEASVKLVPAP